MSVIGDLRHLFEISLTLNRSKAATRATSHRDCSEEAGSERSVTGKRMGAESMTVTAGQNQGLASCQVKGNINENQIVTASGS